MKFYLKRASDDYRNIPAEIEINSIEDLQNLDQKEGEHGLVIIFKGRLSSPTACTSEMPCIIIYDDWID